VRSRSADRTQSRAPRAEAEERGRSGPGAEGRAGAGRQTGAPSPTRPPPLGKPSSPTPSRRDARATPSCRFRARPEAPVSCWQPAKRRASARTRRAATSRRRRVRLPALRVTGFRTPRSEACSSRVRGPWNGTSTTYSQARHQLADEASGSLAREPVSRDRVAPRRAVATFGRGARHCRLGDVSPLRSSLPVATTPCSIRQVRPFDQSPSDGLKASTTSLPSSLGGEGSAPILFAACFQPQGIRPGIDGGDDHGRPRRFFASFTKEASDGNADDN
jgi:hypothetical protein